MAEDPKNKLQDKYKEKGAQQLSYKEYMVLKEKREKRANQQMPAWLKYTLMAPVLIIFCFGLFFLPSLFMSFKEPPANQEKTTDKPAE